MQEKIQDHLRTQIAELKEAEQISNIELEELRKTYLELRNKPVEELPAKAPNTADEYMSQLRSAQENLFQHNQHINRLLEQIQLLKESEKKLVDLQRTNDQLTLQVGSMQKQLAVKDAEMNQMRQQQRLTDELKERLDKVYSEYSTLQGKMQKLEGYLSQPHSKTIEYDELHDSYFRLSKEYDEVKNRHSALWEENQRLSRILSDTEDKLREANFQRQQFQKKTAFLEDLNKDLQEAAEYSKKLESQIKRISEMESMLGRSKGERHDL
jgi:chromosome segregation ATPase